MKPVIFYFLAYVGNVFRLPIRQFKFLGTIEFLFSILDLKYSNIAALCALENLSYKSMKASC